MLVTGSILSPQKPGFNLRTVHVGFVVDNVAVERFLSEFFDFLLFLSFHQCSLLSVVK
jgi:hypothetical protein